MISKKINNIGIIVVMVILTLSLYGYRLEAVTRFGEQGSDELNNTRAIGSYPKQ